MSTPFKVKDAVAVRADILRTERNGLIARGIPDPQLGPGSHEYVLATAIGNEIAAVNSNVQIKADAQMPDSATGIDLDRQCAMFGLVRRTAGPSIGFVVLSTTADTFIAVGSQLLDSVGLRYEVSVGGTYTNTYPNNQIPIQAIDTGTNTNHDGGDPLRWVSTPAFAAPIASVSAAGLAGGVDAEGDEDLRARLLTRWQNPPNNGNWSQIAALAEASSTVVQKAFVYPAVNGPSTVHVAVVEAPELPSASTPTLINTSKNRDVDAALMTGLVVPYIQGQLPEYVESIITTVVNVPNDVSVGMSLPASPAAQPSGPGGGWLDGSPWPRNSTGSSTFKCTVTAVTSSTVFTVDAPTPPQPNVSHIAFLDPRNWKLYHAKVLSYTGTTGAYVITIDTPFPGIAIGSYVWPDCVRAQAYVDALLTAFGQMGPGEKTAVAGNLARGYRHPLPANSWPYTLGATQLRQITDAGEEVLDVAWYYRLYSTPPAIPSPISNAPSIYVPRQIGFYSL